MGIILTCSENKEIPTLIWSKSKNFRYKLWHYNGASIGIDGYIRERDENQFQNSIDTYLLTSIMGHYWFFYRAKLVELRKFSRENH